MMKKNFQLRGFQQQNLLNKKKNSCNGQWTKNLQIIYRQKYFKKNTNHIK